MILSLCKFLTSRDYYKELLFSFDSYNFISPLKKQATQERALRFFPKLIDFREEIHSSSGIWAVGLGFYRAKKYQISTTDSLVIPIFSISSAKV